MSFDFHEFKERMNATAENTSDAPKNRKQEMYRGHLENLKQGFSDPDISAKSVENEKKRMQALLSENIQTENVTEDEYSHLDKAA